jgi:hypothetical protein
MIELVTGAAMVGAWLLGGLLRSELQERSKALPDWREAADRLGLQLSPSGRSMRGQLDKHQLQVWVHSRTVSQRGRNLRKHVTSLTLHFERPLPVDLRLRREHAFDGVSRLLGMPEIERGEAYFDSRVKVVGLPTRKLQDYLDGRRMQEIAAFLDAHPSGRIDRREIRVELAGRVRSAELLVSVAQAMGTLAEVLSGAIVEGAAHSPPIPTVQTPIAETPEGDAPFEPFVPEPLPPLPDWMAEQGVRLDPDDDER